MKHFVLIFILFVLLFTSCQESYFYESSFVAENSEWLQNDMAQFDVSIPDTNRIYNLHLDIKHSNAYAYENLYVLIKTSTPKGEQLQKRINIDMADKSGKWFGKCNNHSCKLRINLQPNAFFDVPGDYKFEFEQYMRENPLKGIDNLTFVVEDTGLKR